MLDVRTLNHRIVMTFVPVISVGMLDTYTFGSSEVLSAQLQVQFPEASNSDIEIAVSHLAEQTFEKSVVAQILSPFVRKYVAGASDEEMVEIFSDVFHKVLACGTSPRDSVAPRFFA